VCRNCENLYCLEHAGRGELCGRCTRSSWMAMWILMGVLLLLLAMALVPVLLEKLGR
jgi:hypothetical protein